MKVLEIVETIDGDFWWLAELLYLSLVHMANLTVANIVVRSSIEIPQRYESLVIISPGKSSICAHRALNCIVPNVSASIRSE